MKPFLNALIGVVELKYINTCLSRNLRKKYV